jgi:hypothetical protein
MAAAPSTPSAKKRPRKPRQPARRALGKQTLERIVKGAPSLDEKERQLVDRWCTRLELLLARRREKRSVELEADLFDARLFASFKALRGTALLNSLVDELYEPLFVAAMAWLTGVYERRKEAPYHFDANEELIIEQTLDVLNPFLGLTLGVVRDALRDPTALEFIVGKGGPVKSAMRAMGVIAKRTPHLDRVTSHGKLSQIRTRLEKRDVGIAVVEALRKGGWEAGTPGLLESMRVPTE